MGLWDWIKEQTVVGDVVDWSEEQGVTGVLVGAAVGATLGLAAPALVGYGLWTGVGILGASGAGIGYASEHGLDFLMPEMPEYPAPGGFSGTYAADRPVNTISEGLPIALAVGRVELAGNIIRSNDPGQDEYLRLIVGHCLGSCDDQLQVTVNDVPWPETDAVNHKQAMMGSTTQSPVQIGGVDLFSAQHCAYRGLHHTGFKLDKADPAIGQSPTIREVVRAMMCEPIGGGTAAWTRDPAVFMWHWYRYIEGYAAAALNEDAFNSLSALCAAFPATGDGAPHRPPVAWDTVQSSSRLSSEHHQRQAIDPDRPIDGPWQDTGWLAESAAQECFIVDLGVSVVLTKIALVNAHNDGANTNYGIQNFIIQGTNNPAYGITYADNTNWTNVQTGLAATAYNSSDPVQDYAVSSPGTAYRRYRLNIADNHGGAQLGFRDVEFWGRSPRYTFDFAFDSKISINDAKKLIWRSFNGCVIRSQGQLKPVWDHNQMADGAGGLIAKTSQFSFNEDNIVPGSLNWWRPERPNIITIHYKDAAQNFKKSSVSVRDDSDIETRGEVLYEETCWYITAQDTARRRADRKLKKARYVDFMARLSSWATGQRVEALDLVDVTHSLPGWSAKEFVVAEKNEDAYGRPTVTLEAYHSGMHTDEEVPLETGYRSTLPAPHSRPFQVSNVAVSDQSYWSNGGIYVPQFEVTYDLPANRLFWERARVQTAISVAGSANLSTAGTSTTVTLPAGDYTAVSVGTVLVANSLTRAILSKDGANQVTVTEPVDWSAGHSFVRLDYSDYPTADRSLGAGFTVQGNFLGVRNGDTVYIRVVSANRHGVEADDDFSPADSVAIDIDIETDYAALPTTVRNMILPEGTYTLSGSFDFIDRDFTLEGVNRDGVIIQNNATDHGLVLYNLTSHLTIQKLTLDSQSSGSYSSMIYVYGDTANDNTSDVLISKVRFLLADNGSAAGSGDRGIHAHKGSGKIIVDKCLFEGGRNPVEVDTYARTIVGSCRMDEPVNQAVTIKDTSSFIVINNQIKDFRYRGIYLYGTIDTGSVGDNQLIFKNDGTASQDAVGIYSQTAKAAISRNVVTIEHTSATLAQKDVGIWLASGTESCTVSENQITVSVDGRISNKFGIYMDTVTLTNVIGNAITVDSTETTASYDHIGIYMLSSDNNTVSVNDIDMVNARVADPEDMGIVLFSNSDNNNISGNGVLNVGAGLAVVNLGSGNKLSGNTRNGVNIATTTGAWARAAMHAG